MSAQREAEEEIPEGWHGSWCLCHSVKKKHQSGGRLKARGTGADTDDNQEVGGQNKSGDVGERQATGPNRAKAARVDTSLMRET
jgi:hypothetical protein